MGKGRYNQKKDRRGGRGVHMQVKDDAGEAIVGGCLVFGVYIPGERSMPNMKISQRGKCHDSRKRAGKGAT